MLTWLNVAGADVVIPTATVVVVNIQLPVLRSITINGTLIFKNLGFAQNVQVCRLPS